MSDTTPSIPRKMPHELYIKTVAKLSRAFPGGFVYPMTGEYIAHKRANSYFGLHTCETELDVKCKVLEWLSRDAYKTQPFHTDAANNKFNTFIRTGINEFLGTNFTEEDMELVYTYLGNRCNHERTIAFVESGYDMQMLYDIRQKEQERYEKVAKEREIVYTFINLQKDAAVYPFAKTQITRNDAQNIASACKGDFSEETLLQISLNVLGASPEYQKILQDKIELAVMDFIQFKDATSVIYPFAVAYEDVSAEQLNEIVKECNGSDNAEVIYNACDKVLGINPELAPER